MPNHRRRFRARWINGRDQLWRIVAVLACLFQIFGSSARAGLPALCEEAARIASRDSGVPLDVLRAISLTETGRTSGGQLRPWPWAVNMEGSGHWFESQADALAYVDRHFAAGARSFDVGCFQINYRWHGHAFTSIQAMFDPVTNARYAAGFLDRLYRETGDWSRAAGAYHSRTPHYAERYRVRFDRIRADLAPIPENPDAIVTQPGNPRINRFPLLLTDAGGGQMGSLVPMSDSPASSGLFLLE